MRLGDLFRWKCQDTDEDLGACCLSVGTIPSSFQDYPLILLACDDPASMSGAKFGENTSQRLYRQ